MAKHLKTFRVVVHAQPCVNRAGTVFNSHLAAVSGAVAVRVVNAQKLVLRFAAAGAATAIGGQDFLSTFQARFARGFFSRTGCSPSHNFFGVPGSITAGAFGGLQAIRFGVGRFSSLVGFTTLLGKFFGVGRLPLFVMLFRQSRKSVPVLLAVSLHVHAPSLGVFVWHHHHHSEPYNRVIVPYPSTTRGRYCAVPI